MERGCCCHFGVAAQTGHPRQEAIEDVEAELQEMAHRVFLNGGMMLNVVHLARRKVEREKAIQRIKDALAEIDATGVQVKDLDIGLLDFPCKVEGEILLLCWKLGEPTIAHWHGTTKASHRASRSTRGSQTQERSARSRAGGRLSVLSSQKTPGRCTPIDLSSSPNFCHPERSEGLVHLLAAPEIRRLRENSAQVAARAAFLRFEDDSSARRATRPRRRAKPCAGIVEDRAGAGRSAKITLYEAIIYVDWAQTGIDACFHGSGGSGLWGQLQGVLRKPHNYELYDHPDERDRFARWNYSDVRVGNRQPGRYKHQYNWQSILVRRR